MSAPNDEGRAFAAPSPRDQPKETSDDSAAKAFASLQAGAALAGWQLLKSGRHFVLVRWNRAIDCADLDAVRGALRRMGLQA